MAAKKNNKGLQKITDSETKLKVLLRKNKITKEDTEGLTTKERNRLGELTTEQIKKASPEERDKILNKIEYALSDQTKNDFWEYNHSHIMYAISSLMKETGRMPSRSEIAKRAEVSRTTVYKHLKEYAVNPLYTEQLQMMRILATNVMAKVYESAMAGDIGSQKLYCNVSGLLGGGTHIQNQNNYIQINGMILSQETIKHLSPEQLITIENILKSVILQPKISAIETTEK